MGGPSNEYYSRAYIKSLENELAIHRQKAQRYREAIASLESERHANELLTARVEELEELVESYERVIETSRNQYIPKQEDK